MPRTFSKRIYTWPSFRSAVHQIVGQIDDLWRATRGGRVSRPFAEKIMLAVTNVNGCRYCAYGHTKAALAAGVSEDELQALMTGELGNFPPQEAVALAFAQHYAESAGQPDPAAWHRLINFYGPETAQDIMAYIRMITFGNLYGNTFDALLSRLKGSPAAGSKLVDELGVLLGVFVVVPGELVRHALSGKNTDQPVQKTQLNP